jgi:hypothetical protein
MHKEKRIVTSFSLSPKMHKDFKALAELKYRTMGDHLNVLIEAELAAHRTDTKSNKIVK